TAPQANVNYQLIVSNVTDLSNDGLGTPTGAFQGISGQPKLVSAAPAGPNSILLTFDESMSDDALSPSSYVIKNAAGATLPVLGAGFVGVERRVVLLSTASQAAGTYTIQSITATDLDGSIVATTPGSLPTFQGAPAPSLTKATSSDSTHVVLTFGGPVGD